MHLGDGFRLSLTYSNVNLSASGERGVQVLLRFEVSNHRSIMGSVELSMVAVDENRSATRSFGSLNEQVLTIAGIYGPNASGKSNIVDAIEWLSAAVINSLRSWDVLIPRQPFKFGVGPTEPSKYDVELMVGGVRYAYTLLVEDAKILFEGLYSYPERRRRVLFEREDMDLHFRRGLSGLGGTRELLTPTTLALTAAMRLGEPEIEPFGRALTSIDIVGRRQWPAHWSGNHRDAARHALNDSFTSRLFDDQAPDRAHVNAGPEQGPFNTRDEALTLLRFADLGIDDVQFVDESDGDPRLLAVQLRNPDRPSRWVRLLHRAAGQQIPFRLDEESDGTQTWFALIGPMIYALRNGRLLLVDELDGSLHPRLSARLLELFQDPETNPHGAQLIFTTHDTSLLNHLNRDEVWLTEKGSDGSTALTALAEFGGDKVRRSLNLEKAYLQGRFGAVPEFDQQVLRRALGLAVGSPR